MTDGPHGFALSADDLETFTRMCAAIGHYLSTYCLHARHGDCRLRCKVCEAPCQCACHRPAGD